jgi:hypothetical protein
LAVDLRTVHVLDSLLRVLPLLELNIREALVEARVQRVVGHLGVLDHTVRGEYLRDVVFGDVARHAAYVDTR